MVNAYAVEVSKSSRSKCKKCKEIIMKGDVRIKTSSIDDDREYSMTYYHHPGCFSLPRTFSTGAGKITAHDFLVDHVTDESGGEILPKQLETLAEAIESKAVKIDKTVGEAEQVVNRLKEAFEDDKEPPAKKVKSDRNGEDDLEAECVQAYGIYNKMKNNDLKDILRWNGQFLTGTKPYMLIKCVDGHVRGRLARCNLCSGGKLKLAEDMKTVTCGGTFDEDTHARISCLYRGTVAEAPRWKPWFTEEPSEAEKEEMDKLVAQAKGESASEDLQSIIDKLKKQVADIEWKPTSKKGLVNFTKQLLPLLRENLLDLPESDEAAIQKIGPIVASNRSVNDPAEIIPLIAEACGSSGDKKEKADNKKAAIETQAKCPANAGLAAAFSELKELYFKEGNANAGATYTKLATAVCELDFEVTADNAKGLGKGKTKIAGVGKASAEKMYEFVTTGTIAKLEEKRASAT